MFQMSNKVMQTFVGIETNQGVFNVVLGVQLGVAILKGKIESKIKLKVRLKDK